MEEALSVARAWNKPERSLRDGEWWDESSYEIRELKEFQPLSDENRARIRAFLDEVAALEAKHNLFLGACCEMSVSCGVEEDVYFNPPLHWNEDLSRYELKYLALQRPRIRDLSESRET